MPTEELSHIHSDYRSLYVVKLWSYQYTVLAGFQAYVITPKYNFPIFGWIYRMPAASVDNYFRTDSKGF
jgi:hypothetical protein